MHGHQVLTKENAFDITFWTWKIAKNVREIWKRFKEGIYPSRVYDLVTGTLQVFARFDKEQGFQTIHISFQNYKF
jgi:hypothetical protein